MRNQWLAYVIVAVLAIGAGLAIAGLPSSETVDGTITVPSSTEVTTTLPPATTEPAPAPETTEPVETTEPPVEITTTTTSSTVPDDLPAREDVAVVVANGADVGGLATRTANDLRDLGYEDVTPTDGEESTDETVVYFDDGFEGAAERMVADLGIEPGLGAIQPIIVAPPISDDVDPIDLLVYLGQDRADA